MTPPVLIAHDRPAPYLGQLRARFPDLTFEACESAEALPERLAALAPEVVFSLKCRGLPGPVQRQILDAPSVRWIQVGGAGVDHLAPWDPTRVTVTNCAGVLSPFMAEYVLGAILMTNFGFPAYRQSQAAATWQQRGWTPAAGKTLLVVGLGNSGAASARLARAAGLRILGLRRDQTPTPLVDALFPPERLHEALAEADFVVLHLPLTPDTRGVIDAAALAAMKPTAVLINCARGPVVDEVAIVEALERGGLAHAVLDVFAQEPLPPESPLWQLQNVTITPHVSDSVADWAERFAAFFADNLARRLAGEPLANTVDPARGY